MKYQIQIFATMEENKLTTWQIVNLEMKHFKPVNAFRYNIEAMQYTYYDAIRTVCATHTTEVPRFVKK